MTKLTDTQLVILSTACGRNDRGVFPITASLKGGALNKVLQSLLAKGYVEETAAEAGSSVWRDEDEGPLTLRATHAAAVALGIEPDPETPGPAVAHQLSEEPAGAEEATPPEAVGGPENEEGANAAAEASSAQTEPTSGEEAPKVRAGTKQALLIEMLRRPEGTTIDEVMAATGWQAHTVRGAMAGALKKKLGLELMSEKVGAGGGYTGSLPSRDADSPGSTGEAQGAAPASAGAAFPFEGYPDRAVPFLVTASQWSVHLVGDSLGRPVLG